MFDNDAMDYVCNIVESIDDLFQMVINFISDEKCQPAPADVGAVEFVQPDIVQFIRTPLYC